MKIFKPLEDMTPEEREREIIAKAQVLDFLNLFRSDPTAGRGSRETTKFMWENLATIFIVCVCYLIGLIGTATYVASIVVCLGLAIPISVAAIYFARKDYKHGYDQAP